jgi:membrane protease YdiL (CAAX protease family)
MAEPFPQSLRPQPRRNFIATIFISPDEPRLRAGWRLLVQTILSLICVALITGALAFLPLSSTIGGAIAELALTIGLTVSIFLARRFFDRRPIASLGLSFNRHTLPDLLFGVGAMGVVMGLIYLAESMLGWLRFEGFAWQTQPLSEVLLNTVLPMFGLFILVGWREELLSRGYHLQNLADGLNMTWGVIISSSIFGLLHLANPNSSLIAALGIFFAGLFLAYGYLRTRLLWLPVGLHIGWNFFEGVVFGFPVSGLNTPRLIQQVELGPDLWTGGPFGPEAGLIVLPALLAGAGLIYLYTRGRGPFPGSGTGSHSGARTGSRSTDPGL